MSDDVKPLPDSQRPTLATIVFFQSLITEVARAHPEEFAVFKRELIEGVQLLPASPSRIVIDTGRDGRGDYRGSFEDFRHDLTADLARQLCIPAELLTNTNTRDNMKTEQRLTGRKLVFLTPEEIEELFGLAGLKLDKIVKTTDGDGETEEGPSLHPVYYVRHKVDTVTGTERETLTVWHWEESGGESQEWDKAQYDIQAGEIVGPWGICLDPVEVVKWFIMHGFYFEGEGTAAGMVARERVRQAGKGFTAEHDDMHTDGSLMRAASCFIGVGYAMLVKSGKPVPPCFIPKEWPWDERDWKTPDNPLDAYVIACAMMCAEIDRITRIVEARAAHESAILPAQLMESLKEYVRTHYPKAYATKGPGEASWHVWDGEGGTLAPGGDEADAWDNAAKVVTERVKP